jgi:hypothetical protein
LFVFEYHNASTICLFLNCLRPLVKRPGLEVIVWLLRNIAGRLSWMLSARLTNKILWLIVAIISIGWYFLFISDHGQSVNAFLEGCLMRLVSSMLLYLSGPCRNHVPTRLPTYLFYPCNPTEP